ncbi:MAG: hypothetical protein AAFY88_29575, partial [Acidobacteriota bacterium]
LLEVVDAQPWRSFFDPVALDLSFGDLELRAIGTDQAANTDPAPATIAVTYADITPPATVTGVVARVDGGDVTVTFDANTTDADPAAVRYHVDRLGDSGEWQRLTSTAQSSTTYLDAGRDDGEVRYAVVAVDPEGNESARSEPARALVYTPVLDLPLSPTDATSVLLAGAVAPDATVEVTLDAGEGPQVSTATSDVEGFFSQVLNLERGLQLVTVRAEDAGGNRSKAAVRQMISAARPGQPQDLVDSGVLLDVELTWTANSEADLLGYRVYQNGEQEPAATPVAVTAGDATGSILEPVDGDDATWWTASAGDELELDLGAPRLVRSVELRWRVQTVNESDVVRSPESFRVETLHGPAWIPLASYSGDLSATTRLALGDAYPT